ncbi:uncharacterized protein LOC121386874 [Gigantopelta aegis]|uniref:uncharacterized protein LOC121386874 n=1 Tax=Gigantopelta aegis TaxID=1735272 RepID=UPI001B888061|nr:uncharacterized protein LOC121386874 [Gigantopelta aegis]
MAFSFLKSAADLVLGPEFGESVGGAPSAKKRPLKNDLLTICETLRSLCGILEANIQTEVDRLKTGLEVSKVEAYAEIYRRGADIIKKLTQEIVKSVNAEQDRLIKDLESCIVTSKNDVDTTFTKNKQLLAKAKQNLKLGENLITSGSDADIETDIDKLQKLASEISETNRKPEIVELKITLNYSIKKNTETFSVNIGEICKPYIIYLEKPGRNYYIPNLADTRPDRRTDRLILTDTLQTKISSDERDPRLQSIAVLEREKKFVVSDRNNECIKCFSTEISKFLFKYKLPCPPFGLARLDYHQVVVALPDEHQIFYLDIQDDIHRTNTLNTEKRYCYITVLASNRLAVGEWCGVCVDILDERGRVIQSLPRDLSPGPTRLTVTGHYLKVVSKLDDSLKSVSSSGRVTWQSHVSARLRYLVDVAQDYEDFLYVCDDQRNCIVQLSRDGEVIREVITDQDGISGPLSVCCDRDELYVAQKDAHVKIFTWRKANP